MDGNELLCVLTDAEKWYGGPAPALGPVDLELRAGEILGVRGPNGAGKSTLLGLMAGVLRPDRGSCQKKEGIRIGYVPQDLSLYHSLSGPENLKFWGLAAGLPPKAVSARTRWLMEQLELSQKGKQKVSSYSGGMQRRLHLATALMATPQLLLLDEPTVGADDRSSALILSMLRRLGERGCGIALISHRSGELEQVCSRILTLEGGRITAEEARP